MQNFNQYPSMNNYSNNQNYIPYYNQSQYFNQNAQNSFQQIQPSFLPLVFVNGIEGAKSFNVQPGKIVYLKDSDSNILYEKRSDNLGKCTLEAYELRKVDINNINNLKMQNDFSFATKDELKKLESAFSEKINELFKTIQNTQLNADSSVGGINNEQ